MDLGLFVAGSERGGVGWISRANPAKIGEVVGRVAAADGALVDEAVRAAAQAFADWSARPVAERGALLRAATAAVLAERDGLAELLTRELGKVITDTRGEIAFAHLFVDYCVGVAEKLLADRVADDEQGRLVVMRQPYGVVGAITPWNAPVILTSLKVAPALATGNTIVVKPSPLAPLTVTRVLAIMARHLPPGVLNVVNGGSEVGDALVAHPAVRKLAFTGGGATARAIMRRAAETLKPLVLELGGNDPAIFLEDADLSPAAMERAVLATFLTTGQVCMAAKRLYVHRTIADEFVERYVEVARAALVVGDPLDEQVTVGPLATAEQAACVQALVEDARGRGGRVIELGAVPDPGVLEGGYFLRPTLVTGVADDAPIVAQEQFGPTVPLLEFSDTDEVIARANRGELALASSVWSRDVERAFALARRLQTGFTFINTHNRTGLALRAPFGGCKQSGFGREFGEEGVLEYVQTHAINLPAAVRDGSIGDGRSYPGT